jgi:hypothetical protein
LSFIAQLILPTLVATMAVVPVDELDKYLKAPDIEDDTVFYPDEILHRLFSAISSPSCRHSQRYASFIEDGGVELRTTLLQCPQPEGSDHFSNPNGNISVDR